MCNRSLCLENSEQRSDEDLGSEQGGNDVQGDKLNATNHKHKEQEINLDNSVNKEWKVAVSKHYKKKTNTKNDYKE